MDQEEPLDFKSIRAKFQESDFFLKPPKTKPALPEKPKVVPPPQPLSPTHFLPAGARASLLTTINQSLESKTLFAPRVVFKDDKKDSKTHLIHTDSKTKQKGDVNNKTAKEVKEKLNSLPPEGKEKKENGKGKNFLSMPAQKDTEDLVPASAQPKATTQKRKGILGFKKSSKQGPEPILIVQNLEVSGSASQVSPVSCGVNEKTEADTSDPQSPLKKNHPVLQEIPPMSPIPAPQNFSSTPTFIPDILAPSTPPSVAETPAQIESHSLPIPTTASQNENHPDSPSVSPTPPMGCAIPDAPVEVSAPSPLPSEFEAEAEAALQALNVDAVESPLPPRMDSPVSQTPPKVERPISVLSALERAEDMSYGKRTPPGDLRILSALENARKKSNSPLSNPTQTSPSPEELAPPTSPTPGLLELPPIDYEDKTEMALPSKPEKVNGTDYRQAPPVSEGVTDQVADPTASVLVVPTPPPTQAHQDLRTECPAPDEPDGPLSEDFIPPPLFEVIPVPPEFSEEIPEVEPSNWENEERTALDRTEILNPTAFYSNGVTDQEFEFHVEPEVHPELVQKEKHLDHSLPEHSFTVFNELPPKEELDANNHASYHDDKETVHEDIQVQSKKKGKSSNNDKKPLKKRTPKNPYVEASQEPSSAVQSQVPERTRTGRFGRNDKKTVTDGQDEKELKKKEKQRLEKEKKELKEKQEREKKEQKEREKREHEVKKKFKITGQEEAMYQARVIETTKGRKSDLPVKSGDVVSIIRTTKCPKGKWLARDSSNNYGYVAVGHVELDIKEMLELGKKTQRKSSVNLMDIDGVCAGGIATNHLQQSADSFSDDSEEWTCDEEEPMEHAEPFTPVSHTRSISMPDGGQSSIPIIHQHSHSDMSTEITQTQGRNEALQKLATFFHSPKPAQTPSSTTKSDTGALPTSEDILVPEQTAAQEAEFDGTAIILPPPDLYADLPENYH